MSPELSQSSAVAPQAAAVSVVASDSQLVSSRAEPRVLGHFRSHARFWLVAGLGLWLDLWSKEWAFHTLRQDREITIVPGILTFKTMFNPGALFGIGAGKTTLFLIASVLALALVFWMFVQSSPRRWALHIALGGILAGALGNMYDRVFVRLIELGGDRQPKRYYVVAENDGHKAVLREYPPTADDSASRESRTRVLFGEGARLASDPPGYVRDFIKIETRVFGKSIWPWVFNVADMLLVGGVSILALYLLADGRRPKHSPARPDEAPPPAASSA